MNYPGSLPENANINPTLMQQGQSVQQVAQNQEMRADIAQSQAISAISGVARTAAAQQDSVESQANALKQYYAAEIQKNAGQGGSKMMIAQQDPMAIMRQLGY